MLDIFIIDDSPVALESLKRIIDSQPDMQVQYKCSSGEDAVKMIPLLKPDIVCLDYYMPNPSGVKLVKAILNVYPVPILIISGLISNQSSKKIFDVLQAGALDFVVKPSSYDLQSEVCQKLIEKIRILSNVRVMSRAHKNTDKSANFDLIGLRNFNSELIVIGSSLGGPKALQEILTRLPGNFPIPIVCIQHISKGFLTPFFEWIQSNCKITCKLAEHKEKLNPETVYFAPEGKNIVFNEMNEILLEHGKPSDLHCPLIDITMKSAADKLGSKVLGILLTGMGSDGAKGMLKIFQRGGYTIAQSEESCTVFGMPKQAIELGAVKQICDLEQIATYLSKKFI